MLLFCTHWLVPYLVWVLDYQSFGRSWGVMWCLFCESRGHSRAIDHQQTFTVSHFCKNDQTTKKYILWQTCFADTGCECASSMASKKAIIKQLAKSLCQEKNYLICLWRIPVHHSCWYCVTLHFICWGTGCQCILNEADWTKLVVAMAKHLYTPPCINSGQHMCSCVVSVALGCERLTACLLSFL